MPLGFLGVLFLLYVSIDGPPICPWWFGRPRRFPPPDNGPGPDGPQEKAIGNIHLVGAAGLIMTTIASNTEEALSLRYGPFILFLAIRVLTGLYYNNTSVPAERKVKM
jgi:hypothetical protein